MGITASNIRLVAKSLRQKETICGSALIYSVLGVQGTYSEVEQILREEEFPYHHLSENEIVMDSLTNFGVTIHVTTLFRMFGYDTVDTLDLFADEHPAIIADLNAPLPTGLWNRYDLVFDSGTTEHCFNVKEVLGNAVRALKVGGRIIHILPVSGFAGHGFYQFSPDLFSSFYGQNGFDEIEMKIELHNGLKAYYFDFDPDRPLSADFWGAQAQVFFTARKVRQAEEIAIPNQRVFELPLDHPLRAGKESTPLMRLAKKLLPEDLKKYLWQKRFFRRTKLHPLF
jgi:SAM-dependent methyltransferase